MSEQFKAALLRSFVGGVVSAGSVFFLVMSVIGMTGVARAGIAAGAAFFGVIAQRGFHEGSSDTRPDNGKSAPGSEEAVRLRFS